jgi:hypothetical protein
LVVTFHSEDWSGLASFFGGFWEGLQNVVAVDDELGEGVDLLWYLYVGVLLLIHFAKLVLNSLIGLSEGHEFGWFNVGDDYLTE